MTQLLPPKKEVALALLERSNVDVYLDPRAKGVVVPPQFRKEPRLILKIGLNMPVPIPDLRLDEDSMSCTLSFNRSPFYCVVPWPSVFAMVGEDGRGMVWPDDVPQELAVKVVEPGAPAEGSTEGRDAAPASPRARAGRKGDEARANGKKGGGKKKKEEPARPVLVAVPQESSEAREKPPSRRKPEGAPSPASPSQSPASQSPSSPSSRSPGSRPSVPASQRPGSIGQPRPKRELPPYLRVVK